MDGSHNVLKGSHKRSICKLDNNDVDLLLSTSCLNVYPQSPTWILPVVFTNSSKSTRTGSVLGEAKLIAECHIWSRVHSIVQPAISPVRLDSGYHYTCSVWWSIATNLTF